MKIFLDDERMPAGAFMSDCMIARTYDEAVALVKQHGFPEFVSFDHDLGERKTGYDFAKYLVDLDLETNTMPSDFWFYVHSQNPIGARSIMQYLDSYLKMKRG